MTKLSNYAHLANRDALPKMVQEGLKLYGTVEKAGMASNPIIMGWAKETGLSAVYTADSVPWCGLWMAVVAKRAGYDPVAGPLWALNWGKFGIEAGQPDLGDILTFIRPSGGHVGLYVGEDAATYHVLGGNQSDAVTIMRIEKQRLRAVRSPAYRNRPATARPYIVLATGAVSRDEA
jgi:uncharacterized protein (TIGR02594 family)